MMTGIHAARLLPFSELYAGLRDARESRLVSEVTTPEGLALYCYSSSCVFDRAWSPITLLARGLILEPRRKRVVATPFPKFFQCRRTRQSHPGYAFRDIREARWLAHYSLLA